MISLPLGLSIGTPEVNVVGVILGKRMRWTHIATDVMPLEWSVVQLLEMWEGFLLGIVSGGKVDAPLGCWVGKWIGVPLGFKICNTVWIVLGIYDCSFLGVALGKNLTTKKVC